MTVHKFHRVCISLLSVMLFTAPAVAAGATSAQPEAAATQEQGVSQQHPNLFRMSPSASSAPTITPTTALKGGPTNTYGPAIGSQNATSIPEWSAARIREIFPYDATSGPAPGSETMPRLAPLR